MSRLEERRVVNHSHAGRYVLLAQVWRTLFIKAALQYFTRQIGMWGVCEIPYRITPESGFLRDEAGRLVRSES